MSSQHQDIEITELQKSILDLEEKYFKLIETIFKTQEFILDLQEIEKNIKKNYAGLSMYWQVKNKIKIPLERLLRYHIYKYMNATGTYYSPLSSDIAFYTSDALINIDAKTTDLNGNGGDDISIIFDRNQITFKNKIRNVAPPFLGVNYVPNMPPIDLARGLPILTFFLRITYTDDFKDFDINTITLDCVPNGELSELFEYDLIKNFKTYEYITTQFAKKLEQPNLKPVKEKRLNWKELKVGGGTYFYDDKVSNPFFKSEKVIWGKIGGYYKAMYSGGSARISPKDTVDRYNGSNEPWTGHTRWNVDVNANPKIDLDENKDLE